MSTQPAVPITVPFLEQVKDRPTYSALRFLGDQVGRLTRGAFQGTLSPDQKPTNLGVKDVGQQFFATDFARGYRWTGSSWQDLPDAPSRFQCVLFAQAPEPPIGWSPCNGQNTVRSTSSGGVAQFTTPNIPFTAGLQYWMRL